MEDAIYVFVVIVVVVVVVVRATFCWQPKVALIDNVDTQYYLLKIAHRLLYNHLNQIKTDISCM